MRQLALLLVVVASCKKSESTAPATGSAGATPASASAGSTPGTAAPAGSAGSAAPSGTAGSKGKIECAKVIPKNIADKYFKDSPTKHEEPTGDYGDGRTTTTCRFIIDEKTNTKILVEYHCGGEFADVEAYLAQQQALFPKTKIKRVNDIGRGAFQLHASAYGAQHRSLPCVIMVDLAYLDENDPLRKKDYFALLRELEVALPDAP